MTYLTRVPDRVRAAEDAIHEGAIDDDLVGGDASTAQKGDVERLEEIRGDVSDLRTRKKPTMPC